MTGDDDLYRLLPRFRRRALDREAEAKVAEIVAKAEVDRPTDRRTCFGRPAGDERTLRGIPVIGNMGGAIAGTRPDSAIG